MGQAEHAFFRDLCETIPDAIVVVDAEGQITYTNARVSDLFGYQPEELLEEPVEILVPTDLRDDHVAHRAAYMDDPQTRPMGVGLSLTGQRKDGSTFPVEISLSPVEMDGRDAVIAVVRDTSERESLRTKYRAIMETAPDCICVADAETGDIIEVNDRAAELMGYSKAELEDMHQTDLHPSEEVDRYRALFEDHIEANAIQSSLPDGSPIYVETRNGEQVPVEINARTFELDDHQLITGVFRDISERRERNRELERVEQVINASGDPVYMLDADGRFTFVNEAIERLSGYDQADLIGKPASMVMEPEDVERAEQIIRNLLISDRDRDTFEMTIRTADGETIPTENHIAVIETEEGRLDATVGVVRDISERKARERDLERQNQRLDEFASVVSHDLRNPLTLAAGKLDLAQRDHDDDRLDEVRTALDRMNQIIEDTLTLARQGETVGETDCVDLADFADRCWRTVDTDEADLRVDDPPTVEADRSRLRHLFENLFRNAIDHGGSTVTVTVGQLDDGFYVADDGPGIPPDDRERVFDAGESFAENGTGLGLAIAKRIVEAHEWEIEVTDSAAGGARFEVLTDDA